MPPTTKPKLKAGGTAKEPGAGIEEAAKGPIPPQYLNSMGFIDYDHFGNLPWKSTREKIRIPEEYKAVTPYLALDCEMVGISEEFDDRELARVSVVNQHGFCLFDSFAKPKVPVVSYHTKWSGVTEKDLRHAPCVDKVRQTVWNLINGKILVGHSIHHDLDILGIPNYPSSLIRDTADFFRFRIKPGEAKTPGLKQLCERYLQVQIQNDKVQGHSSIQDSQAAMKLYLLHANTWEWEFGIIMANSRKLGMVGGGNFIFNPATSSSSHQQMNNMKSISEININPEKKDLFVDSSTVSLLPNRILGPYASSQEYVDIQFRLLLEDLLRPLRDGVQIVNYKNRDKYGVERLFWGVSVELCREREDSPNSVKKNKDLFYGFVKIPIDSNRLRSVDWSKSKRFLTGSLIVLSSDSFNTVHFGIVQYLSERSTEPNSNAIVLQIKFSVKTSNKISLRDEGMKRNFCLIESRAFFEAYKHTLEFLKTVDLDEFPMKKYIVDVQTSSAGPPERLVEKLKAGELEELDFGVFLKDNSPLKISNLFDEEAWPSPQELGLDQSQLLALRQAMTQEISIIQGPPGCGKTFIGVQIVKLLLTNLWLLDDSPIMIVSYTNHALDEILERIFRFYSDYFCGGNDGKASLGMIRLGGCSESEVIKPLTLVNKEKQRKVAKEIEGDLKKAEKSFKTFAFLKELFAQDPWLVRSGILDLSTLLNSDKKSWRHVSKISERIKEAGMAAPDFGLDFWIGKQFKSNPTQVLGLNGLHEMQKKNAQAQFLVPRSKIDLSGIIIDRFRFIFSQEECVVESFLQTQNWSHLPAQDLRYVAVWKSYFGIIQVIREYIEALHRNIRALTISLARIGPVQSKKEHIKSAKIIGMTTTGAVKNKGLILGSFQPRVVLVEEAAHILEAHVVSSLTHFCDQLILIGDHKQLRPLTADSAMSWRYKLDVSLMERLVRNGMVLQQQQGKQNWVQLKVQHRMREEVARLVCPLIYKELENHDCVREYGNVKGCRKNVFFIDHEFPETKEPGAKSFHNLYEIEVITALAKFFVGNGRYSPSQVSIIATYKAQADLIGTRLQLSDDSDLASIRVSTVDGYQGEENDIILLSLVRSNDEERIGFLSTNNRLCVALSRAKHGLFMTGNMKCLSGAAENWETIETILKDMEAIGFAKQLPLIGKNAKILHKLKDFKMPLTATIASPGSKIDINSIVNQMRNLSLATNNYNAAAPISPPPSRPVSSNIKMRLRNAKNAVAVAPSPSVSVPIQSLKIRLQCGHVVKEGKKCYVQVSIGKNPTCKHEIIVPCYFKDQSNSIPLQRLPACNKLIPLTCRSCGLAKPENKIVECWKHDTTYYKCEGCRVGLGGKVPEKPAAVASIQTQNILPQSQINHPAKAKQSKKTKGQARTSKKCSKVFNCGHTCQLETDHENRSRRDRTHENYRCPLTCERTAPRCNHKCDEGHPCWTHCKLTAAQYKCPVKVPEYYSFSCGHQVSSLTSCAYSAANNAVIVVQRPCVKCGGIGM